MLDLLIETGLLGYKPVETPIEANFFLFFLFSFFYWNNRGQLKLPTAINCIIYMMQEAIVSSVLINHRDKVPIR